MATPLIYLAAPYSHASPDVMAERAALIQEATEILLLDGYAVFSPITYGAQMENVIGTNFEPWARLNDAIIRKCDHFFLLRLTDWELSRGVGHELRLWTKLHPENDKVYAITMEFLRDADTRHNLPGRKG